jgi:hypothetical protein
LALIAIETQIVRDSGQISAAHLFRTRKNVASHFQGGKVAHRAFSVARPAIAVALDANRDFWKDDGRNPERPGHKAMTQPEYRAPIASLLKI